MVIVPSHDEIEVEAHVLNKDVGFVREGQQAAVKIEAFPSRAMARCRAPSPRSAGTL
jgi:multidrug resistance efflux pump